MAELNPANENEAGRFVAAVLDDANEQRLKVAQPALMKLHTLRREVVNMSVKMTAKKRLGLAKEYEAKLSQITGALAKIEQNSVDRIDAYLSALRSHCGAEKSKIEAPLAHGAFVSIALPRPLGSSRSGPK